ncbi:MAG: hypothetical protein V1918_02115, partial [Planctomycetota bacterium]
LGEAPLADIAREGAPVLAEAIGRMREARVIRRAGFDGEYGSIRLFETGELDKRGDAEKGFVIGEEYLRIR